MTNFEYLYGEGSYGDYLIDNGYLRDNSNWEHKKTEKYGENDWDGFNSNANWLSGANVVATKTDFQKEIDVYNAQMKAPNSGGELSYTGIPDWVNKTNIGIGAFTTANGVKTELIEFAGKSASLGKSGAQYLKYAKGLGYVGAGLTTTYTSANAGIYYYNGGTDWQVGAKATLDVVMTGVTFLGPIGLGISATYFIVDVAGGFGDFGEIKP